MLSKLRTFASLPVSHKRILLELALLVPIVEISIRTLKFRRTLKALKHLIFKTPVPPNRESVLINNYRASYYLFDRQFPNLGKCLARSLVLWYLLERVGISTELKFGSKKEDGILLAHAWLEYDNAPLIDEPDLDLNYKAFTESILSKI